MEVGQGLIGKIREKSKRPFLENGNAAHEELNHEDQSCRDPRKGL